MSINYNALSIHFENVKEVNYLFSTSVKVTYIAVIQNVCVTGTHLFTHSNLLGLVPSFCTILGYTTGLPVFVCIML